MELRISSTIKLITKEVYYSILIALILKNFHYFLSKMIRFLIFLSLFNLIFSASIMTFIEEQNKIMTIFNTLNAYKRNQGSHFFYRDLRDHVDSLLKLDSVNFLQEMQRVTDKIFLLTFWNTFSSPWIFLCSDTYNQKVHKEFKDFIDQISLAGCVGSFTTEMLFHFKVFLMQALVMHPGDKVEIWSETKKFYDFKLKKLILEVLGEQQDYIQHTHIKEMIPNFRFYYHCVEKENLKILLTKEFHMLKTALESDNIDQIAMHEGNMTFLAGMLTHDRSSLFGLLLIEDQSPEFVGYFLLMQLHLNGLLKRHMSLRDHKPKFFHDKLLKELFVKFPIFEDQAFKTSTPQFKLLEKFTNFYDDVLSNEALIELVRTLFKKIILS
jgi:hypothetical protein